MRKPDGTKRPKVELYCDNGAPQSPRNTQRLDADFKRESRTFPSLAEVASSSV